MARRTRADYEQIIELAFKGYTGEGVGEIVGKHPSNVSAMLSETGLSFKDVRSAKRAGKTLGAIISKVDWGFMDAKEAAIQARSDRLRKGRPVASAKPSEVVSLASEIAEIKRMLNDIYNAMTAPQLAQKSTLLGKVANGAWRNQ